MAGINLFTEKVGKNMSIEVWQNPHQKSCTIMTSQKNRETGQFDKVRMFINPEDMEALVIALNAALIIMTGKKAGKQVPMEEVATSDIPF